jgi:hypothetical protein
MVVLLLLLLLLLLLIKQRRYRSNVSNPHGPFLSHSSGSIYYSRRRTQSWKTCYYSYITGTGEEFHLAARILCCVLILLFRL